MFTAEAEDNKKDDVIPVDSRPEPEILPQPLNAILKELEEFQMRYDRESDSNDKFTYDYHFDE